ncbi:hypothetical protein K505DRAFT_375197 [Melanomma pulvis-pyrius CBS 109.77]|uniref:Uncharacterized protein n=1 Tax=Melanomma pulvis-pyrius CBS 109.77 TaxID=1314802 RepID=A0A6A6XCC6_9PLEO|nr:hypothetical protein K505DRAFT_375197 [Melanomma pulvis-pyrius CBS 109.77]
MASSEGSSRGASQLPKSEATPIVIKINTKFSRRQWTLIAITALLHVLLWSSVCTLITSLYLIAADPGDTTNIPSEVFTLASAFVSIAYIIIHTIFSLKQRIWKHQRRNPSIIKKTSYIAIRLAVTLCILWLLTSGWNLIIVARQPVCLPAGAGLEGWEAGTTCVVGRIGTTFSIIALIASCTLFGMLAVVRRPFEAHPLKYRYREPINPYPTPAVSPQSSPSHSASSVTDTYRGRISASTRQSTMSTISNTDVETVDLDSTSPPSTIYAPSPIRSLGLGIFRSSSQPPPLPPAFMPPQRASSVGTPPQIFYPSLSSQHLPLPPRMSTLIAPSGSVPLSNPMQYSASAWRAVHPTLPSPLRPVSYAARSNPHLPHTASGPNFSYRSGYSRSSISLTRPRRLSSATPPPPAGSVTWSSRSGSTGPDEGRRSRSPESGDGSTTASTNDHTSGYANGHAPAHGITGAATASMNVPRGRKHGHVRRASDSDTTCGAQEPHPYSGRKAKGWKPRLHGQEETLERNAAKITRSSSAELLSKFSPDSSPDDNTVDLRKAFENELEARWSIAMDSRDRVPVRKSRSASPLRGSAVPESSAKGRDELAGRATKVSRMPQEPRIAKQTTARIGVGAGKVIEGRRLTFDEVKNKPLPRIAAL